MTQLDPTLRVAVFCLSGIFLFSAAETAAGTGTLQISSDPFTNSSSQHMTEVEPHIFANGSTIVATFQQGRIFGGGSSDIGFATSVDSGATWQAGSLPGITIFYAGGSYSSASDPAVVFDIAHGTWMIVILPVGRPAQILVSRSPDGLNWDNPVSVIFGGNSSYDKPWITCDNTPTSQFFGNCYVEWDEPSSGGTILMSTSSDGGETWGPALATVDEASGLGGQPLVQPSGRVVVPYAAGAILAFISDDGGGSWGSTVLISDVQRHRAAGGLRQANLPSAAIDGDGTIYVAWPDCRFRTSCRSNDIVVSTSSDGLTWSEVSRVPIDDTTSTADHFIPGLGADRNTFAPNVSLALAYYYYPLSNCTDTTCQLIGGFITSSDGGSSWSAPIDVTQPIMMNWIADTSSGLMVGDYLGTCFTDDGNPHPVFASAAIPDDLFHEDMNTTCSGCAAPGIPPARVVSCASADCASTEQPELDAENNQATAAESGNAYIRVTAESYYINIGSRIQLQATVPGTQNAEVQWSVEEVSGGSVSNSGVYTAPLSPGVYHVVASSGTKRARVTITVFTVI